MKNYSYVRGAARQLIFDPVEKAFVTRTLPHPFSSHQDPLELHLMQDIGIDTEALKRGELRFAA